MPPTGAGYNTGHAGLLLLRDGAAVVSTCAYAKDPATGGITVLGSTATVGANAASVRCRLTDTATGALAWAATRVRVSRVGPPDGRLILFAGGMREHLEGHR